MLGMNVEEDQINNTPVAVVSEAPVSAKEAAVAYLHESIVQVTQEGVRDQTSGTMQANDHAAESQATVFDAVVIETAADTTKVVPAQHESGLDNGKSPALVKEQLKFCATILKGLKRHPQSHPFQLPVDPVALNIPDYFNIIKTPMDLSMITKKIEAGEYADADSFIADVRLMLANCFTYNHPDSQVTKMGKSLEKYFNGAIAKIPQSLPAPEEPKNRRKSEPMIPSVGGTAHRGRRESHAPNRLASTPAAPSPRGRARSTVNPEMAFCNTVMRELLKKTHHSVSWPFLEPVDPVKLGIPDYFDVIKNPMDLSTARRKLETGQYAHADQFATDIRLIFANCYAYNAGDSDVVNLCRAFEKIFESKWAQKPSSFAYPSVSSFDDSDSDSEKILEINQKIQALQHELNSLLMKRKSRSHSSASSASRPKKTASRPTPKTPSIPAITEEEFLARIMTFEEKRQLSIEVNNLSPERLGRVVEIIQAGTSLEAQGDSDVIELDIESLNTRTLRQLQKYVMECKGITSLAVMLGETAAVKRKKAATPSGSASKKPNVGGIAAPIAAPSPAAAGVAAMSTDDESSEDDLD